MGADVLDYLIGKYNIKSMTDIGCGIGGMVDYANSKGLKAIGVDGDPNVARPGTIIHDYTKDIIADIPEDVDLVWSVEFVEHVEQKYMPKFLGDFCTAKYIMLTHALPGQTGYHHVNERSDDFWDGAMAAMGYTKDQDDTNWIRTNAENIYIKKTGTFYKLNEK
jgi:cyclopropane fatty-acyl-phospholipid synthase-like methyltransferase